RIDKCHLVHNTPECDQQSSHSEYLDRIFDFQTQDATASRTLAVAPLGVADFDGDGIGDFFQAKRAYLSALSARAVDLPVNVSSEAAIDFTGDGRADLAQVGGQQNQIQANYAWSTGNGFAAQSIAYFSGRLGQNCSQPSALAADV